METIGKRISIFREKMGITQADVYRSTRIKQQTLSSIESGTEPKSGVVATLLFTYPDLSPDWLLLGRGEMRRGTQPKAVGIPKELPADREQWYQTQIDRLTRSLDRITRGGSHLTATGTDDGSFNSGNQDAAEYKPVMEVHKDAA
jgi:transcriptional regulator with XRE-family HTH domain